jgi:23S rRNA (uridine2552-2'-O)-methyltransferase
MQKKTSVKTAKGRKISSTHWLLRHINDPFVQRAKEEGYISRAAFKLLEIDEKFKIIKNSIKKGRAFLDLGAAPGSWLQVLIAKTINDSVKIFGLDLQDITYSHDRITTLIGDFTDPLLLERLKQNSINESISLIVSDMAPNACGDKKTDHIRIMTLANEVLDFIEQSLVVKGNALIKVLQGALSQELNKRAKNMFSEVHWYKPKASYADSTELYLVLLQKK